MASPKITPSQSANIIQASNHYSDIALDFMTFILFHIHNLNNENIKVNFELENNLAELDMAGYINDCVVWSPIKFNVSHADQLIFLGKGIDRSQIFNEAQFISMPIEEYNQEDAERLFKLIAFR